MENLKKPYLAIFGLILAFGLMASAFILGSQFKNLRQTGTITVKGLAEAEYTATQGTWVLTVNGWGATYKEAMVANQANLNTAVRFLTTQGFLDSEREISEIDVAPHTEYYENEKGETKSRQNGYTATRIISLSTKELVKIQKAVSAIHNLISENEKISYSAPQYYLENLEKIKRELISKATQDAHVRAEEFAKTSNVKVGVLKSASQGPVYILSTAPGAEDNTDYTGSYDTSTIDKKARLVVTIEYAID
ncbi:SIMPL domain-containing protein [uncultured Actinobacillus sp.]|uniref:SIMPL domain-containing protein n=1 Tax=uncultured Actinobacillus sp. TaxID=417616 RepID=UPI0026003FEF|nr:SIMPL domain-containing protein [uncultured Actinobacillus sp.]